MLLFSFLMWLLEDWILYMWLVLYFCLCVQNIWINILQNKQNQSGPFLYPGQSWHAEGRCEVPWAGQPGALVLCPSLPGDCGLHVPSQALLLAESTSAGTDDLPAI